MNRRSFFQRVACAVVGVTAVVYAPGLLKDVAVPQAWGNYTFRYTSVITTGLIKKMRMTYRLTSFRAPAVEMSAQE